MKRNEDASAKHTVTSRTEASESDDLEGDFINMAESVDVNDSAKTQFMATCNQCKKTFKQIKSFNSHKCGLKLQKIKCPSCSKLISRTNLSKHLTLHSAIGHKCSLCSKAYKSEAELKKHTERHAITKCHICGKEFAKSSTLRDHYKTYDEIEALSGNGPPSEKGKGGPLKSKMKTVCRFCKIKVASLNELTDHLRKKHGEKAVSCNLCTAVFFSGRGLQSHMKQHNQQASLDTSKHGGATAPSDVVEVNNNDDQIQLIPHQMCL